MPKIKAVNHVAVVVDDMEKSLLFWRDALGIQLHELRDGRCRWVSKPWAASSPA